MKLVFKNSTMEFNNYEAPKVTLIEGLYLNGGESKISTSQNIGIRYFQLVQGKTYKVTFEKNVKSGTGYIRRGKTSVVPALNVAVSDYTSNPSLESSNNYTLTITFTADSDGYYVFDDYSLKGTSSSVTIEVVED